jgi:hypothetical protein
MTKGDLSLQRLSVRILFAMSLGLTLLFLGELAFDLSRSGVPWSELSATSRTGPALASTVSRAFNNLTAMVLTFIALAVPITANMYTPKLIEIFVRDRINIAAMIFFAGMGAHAVFGQAMMFEQWSPAAIYTTLWVSGVVGFTVLVPYYFYVLSFLNPATIIRLVRDLIFREFDGLAKGVDDVPEARRRLDQEILNFGNVVLRAVDRADRDVSIDAVSGVKQIVLAYAEIKPHLPPAWFEVDRKRFAGSSDDAIELIERDRVWVEHRCLHQLNLAYAASLSKMPDAISAISDVNRRIAEAAARRKDDGLLRLCVRYMNTFLREAVKKKDVHAIYDVVWQYKALAVELLRDRPLMSLEIGRHLKYYAEFARWQGMGFIYELVAADLGGLVEAAYEAGAPTRADLLAVLDSFEMDKAAARLTKSRGILAAFFESKGLAAEAAQTRSRLERTDLPLLEAARAQLLATEDPVFWEVTDRQRNLDYVEPVRREAVRRVLEAAMEKVRGAADAG